MQAPGPNAHALCQQCLQKCTLLKKASKSRTHIGGNAQHDAVRLVAGQTKDGRFDVLLVAGQVDKRDEFGGLVADLLDCVLRIVDDLVH